jgi:hypothetical protein
VGDKIKVMEAELVKLRAQHAKQTEKTQLIANLEEKKQQMIEELHKLEKEDRAAKEKMDRCETELSAAQKFIESEKARAKQLKAEKEAFLKEAERLAQLDNPVPPPQPQAQPQAQPQVQAQPQTTRLRPEPKA